MFALFEDRLAPPGQPAAWLLTELVQQISGHAADLPAILQAARQAGQWTALALDYELGAEYEPVLHAKPAAAPPASVQVWCFARCQHFDAAAVDGWLQQTLAAIPAAAQQAGVGGVHAGIAEADYLQAVQAVQDAIRAGDCYQINLTFPLHCQTFGHPLALYAALRERQPSGHAAFLSTGERSYLSLSPELFLQRQGAVLRTRPMKGTLPRGDSPETDAAQAVRLQQCPKNRAENVMIVDLLRNDLARLGGATPAADQPTVQVAVAALFEVEAYPTVWQMVSQVEARAAGSETSALDLENALPVLFPCGSITGAPKIRAMQIIQALEHGPRGIYTGALGWQSPAGDYRLNVAIRTLVVEADGSATLGVGSGLVQDSVAQDEWAECWLKARFLTAFDPGLTLIETLLLEVDEAGPAWQRLPAHWARMQRSAAWLGYDFQVHRAQAILNQHAVACGPGRWRVRMGLHKNGSLEVVCVPLAAEPDGPRFVQLATETVDSRHPLQGHKTSWRPQYDPALAILSQDPSLFDVLFFNERGELAEGARSSVFVQRQGHWLTPPLHSGVLPGIWRAAVLAGEVAGLTGAREQVLTRDDLLQAEAIVCGNSLRGGVPVSLR